MSTINVRNLSLRYPGQEHPVLQEISCDFPPQEITLLLGPSGSGKSSLALCLNGIIPHMVEAECRGQVNLNNSNLLTEKPLDAALQVGVVLQDPEQQFCTLTVSDEVAFGLENMCLDRREMAERIDQALCLVGMKGWEKVNLTQLSGGQKQKVAIASVLVLDPNILVLDEPTANLDPAAAHEILRLIENLQRQEQKTIILIEHRLEAIMAQAAHMVVLSKDGHLLAEGDPGYVTMHLARGHDLDDLYLPRATRMVIQLRGIEQLKSLPLTMGEAAKMLAFNTAGIERFQVGQEAYQSQEPALIGGCEAALDNEESIKASQPLIKVQNLWVGYHPHQEVLKGLNFLINRGEFLAIVGANGSGKSTLARSLMNIIPDGYKGSIRIKGREVKSLKRKELFQHLGMVFQNPEHQFVANTVEDEIAFNLGKSASNKKRTALVEEFLHRFGLTRERRRNPYQLSQGQKRRLSVASMLITAPELIILDEPTYGQDYRNNNELSQLIAEINREGTAVLVITHDMEMVSEHCRRVMVLNGGRLVFDGPPAELFGKQQLLEACGLQPSPIMSLAAQVQNLTPSFPQCTKIDEFCNYWQKTVASTEC